MPDSPLSRNGGPLKRLGYRRRKLALGVTEYRFKPGRSASDGRYDTEQPWICWWFLTHDLWWPPWTSTRVLGRSRVLIECAVCGHRDRLSLRMPRFGSVPIPKGGQHAERLRFKLAHLHPDRQHPMSWAKPLRNPAAHGKGIDLDLLKMRLEADLKEASDV